MPKVPFWIFIIIALLYFSSIKVDTMDIDASQYAEMSREMAKSGDYLHVYDRGMDYLDKPPFLFWVSALSIKVFGVNNAAYKFPSLLFALWCIYATYRLAKRLYDENTGRVSALILATCQGMFLMTNDVRCDTILMAWVVTAIWMIEEWLTQCKLKYLILAAVCIAFGMMTKGPIALMVPVFCFAGDWALKRQWKNFIRPAYLLAIIIIAVLLIPMSVGLYQQFDMHPEKIVGGKTGVSGLRFFYWSQSFGRITGESPWKNAVDISFLLLNMLWSFLPWIILFLTALIVNTINLAKQRFRLHTGQEWVTTGGFILSYLSLGSSAYQLPHYIFVAFPLAAIVTGRFIVVLSEYSTYKKLNKILTTTHIVIALLLLAVTMLLIGYSFPAPILYIVLLGAGILLLIYLIFKRSPKVKLLWIPAIAIIIANVFLTNHFYYTLLSYQAGSKVGRYICIHHIPSNEIMTYKMRDPLNSINFYANEEVPNSDTIKDIINKKFIVTMDEGSKDLLLNGNQYDTLFTGKLFKVSELTLEFLNPKTRDKETKNFYLLKLRMIDKRSISINSPTIIQNF